MFCGPRCTPRRLSLHRVLLTYCICHIVRNCISIATCPAHTPTAPLACYLQSVEQTYLYFCSFFLSVFSCYLMFSVAKIIQICISANRKF
jgi:hypothetical protein